jgi:hypothetical protein
MDTRQIPSCLFAGDINWRNRWLFQRFRRLVSRAGLPTAGGSGGA